MQSGRNREHIMINESSIVLVGGFNPLIYHPTWFERHKILPIQETDWAMRGESAAATIEGPNGIKFQISDIPPVVVSNQHCEVNFLSFKINVTVDRFIINAREENNFAMIRDTALKILQTLPHTPVTAFGSNFNGLGTYGRDSQTLLNEIFVSDTRKFEAIFGTKYTTSGIVTFEANESRIRFIFERNMNDESTIMYHANYHRDVQTALDAADLIGKFFNQDLANAKQTIKSLLGKEAKQ